MIRKLFLVALLVACGGEADGAPELETKGGADPNDSAPGLVDYASPDAPDVPAFQDPDYVEPEGDAGAEVEKWASGQYHGQVAGVGDICYSSQSAAKKCVFPPYKQVNLVTPSWTTNVTGSNCATQRAWMLTQGASVSDIDNMITAYLDGLRSINGIGTGVVVRVNSAAGTNMTLKIKCETTPAELGAFLMTFLPSDTNGPDLPTFGGINPGRGIKYYASGPDTSYHRISLENIWDFVISSAPGMCNIPPGPNRSLKAVEAARYVGAHEGLHMMGFDHFASGLMNPYQPCTGANSNIPAAFGTALGLYNGNPAGGPTITDVGLGAQGVP